MKDESTQPAELDQLKREVAALRGELAGLKQFFSVEKRGEGNRRPILHIQCSTLTLRDPTDPNRLQGMLAANEDGPALSLWGSDAKARVILSAKKDVACCDLFSKDLKPAVQITVDEPSGRGQVGVLEAGKPRAVMKATDQGGVVSVVHDDGQVRALMLSREHDGGEFMAVTPDMKTGVKISAGAPQGGMVSVNRSNGKPGVLLACTDQSGAVIVNNAKGDMLASLPSVPGQDT
jgi:hypothetical protein